MSDERELRAALEKAQARVSELEAELDTERREHVEREEELEEAVETLEGYLQQEAQARDELAAVVEKLHRALDEVEAPAGSVSPGENREVVKLRAQIAAMRQTQDREREALQQTIRQLKEELLRAKKLLPRA
jgi:septal ring factor EnvC (AmiA/AmiB activator)